MKTLSLILFAALAACTGANPQFVIDGGAPPDLDGLPDGAPPPGGPPSCAALPKTCGVTASGDCCESPIVSGGMFYRSYDAAGDALYADQSNPAAVSSFRLDKYEVTVGRFRAMIAANGPGTQKAPPQSIRWDQGWNAQLAVDADALRALLKCDASFQTWTDAAGASENLPINCVNWFEAAAFCAWDGGRLPTEAEWNYAATGGAEQRAYPWSSPPSSTAIDNSNAAYCGGACVLARVGSRPQGNGKWGQSDLAGNVWEWTLDWYAPYANPCIDCVETAPSANRALRGGSFGVSAATSSALRTGARSSAAPTDRDNSSGFRCARSGSGG